MTHVQALAILAPHMRRTVRSILNRDDTATEALCTIAAEGVKSWTLAEWRVLLASLRSCNDRLDDWLAIR